MARPKPPKLRLNIFGWVDPHWLAPRQYMLRRFEALGQAGFSLNLCLRQGSGANALRQIGHSRYVIHGDAYTFTYPFEAAVLTNLRRLGVVSRLIVDDGGDHLEYADSNTAMRAGRILARADRIIAQTSVYKAFLLSRFPSLDASRISVVPLSALSGLSRVPADDRLKAWKRGDLLIGHSGRIYSAQAEAYRSLTRRGGFKVVTIGSGEKPLGSEPNENLKSLPSMSPRETAGILKVCDFGVVLVSPGFMTIPQKLIDYMSVGLPVFMNRFVGSRDLPPETYIQVGSENPVADIFRGLKEEDPKRVGKVAQAYANSELSSEGIAGKLHHALWPS